MHFSFSSTEMNTFEGNIWYYYRLVETQTINIICLAYIAIYIVSLLLMMQITPIRK